MRTGEPHILTKRSIADVEERAEQGVGLTFRIVTDVCHHAKRFCVSQVRLVEGRGQVDQCQERHDDQIQLQDSVWDYRACSRPTNLERSLTHEFGIELPHLAFLWRVILRKDILDI